MCGPIVASILLPVRVVVHSFDPGLSQVFVILNFPSLSISYSLSFDSPCRGKILSLIRVLVARGEAEESG